MTNTAQATTTATHDPYAEIRAYTYVHDDEGHTIAIRCEACEWRHVYADHPDATFNQPTDPWTHHALRWTEPASYEYRQASLICARHSDDDHDNDQYRPCSGSFIEARK